MERKKSPLFMEISIVIKCAVDGGSGIPTLDELSYKEFKYKG